MRYLVVLALTLPMQGCLFFFYIPGELIDKFRDGNACVHDTAIIGSEVKHTDGRVGKVTKLYGRSDRCRGTFPVLADVEFPPSTDMVKGWDGWDK